MRTRTTRDAKPSRDSTFAIRRTLWPARRWLWCWSAIASTRPSSLRRNSASSTWWARCAEERQTMSYSDLLTAVAKDAGIPSAQELVAKHAHKYLHLIKSRDRARELVASFRALLDVSFKGQAVLELGSGVGSLSIEFAHLGAAVTAIEPSARWLGMAQEHARNEAKVEFVKADLLHSLQDFPESS